MSQWILNVLSVVSTPLSHNSQQKLVQSLALIWDDEVFLFLCVYVRVGVRVRVRVGVRVRLRAYNKPCFLCSLHFSSRGYFFARSVRDRESSPVSRSPPTIPCCRPPPHNATFPHLRLCSPPVSCVRVFVACAKTSGGYIRMRLLPPRRTRTTTLPTRCGKAPRSQTPISFNYPLTECPCRPPYAHSFLMGL